MIGINNIISIKVSNIKILVAVKMFFVEPDIKTVARKVASDNLRFIAYKKGSKEVKKGSARRQNQMDQVAKMNF